MPRMFCTTMLVLAALVIAGLSGCQKEIKEIRNPNQTQPVLASAADRL